MLFKRTCISSLLGGANVPHMHMSLERLLHNYLSFPASAISFSEKSIINLSLLVVEFILIILSSVDLFLVCVQHYCKLLGDCL